MEISSSSAHVQDETAATGVGDEEIGGGGGGGGVGLCEGGALFSGLASFSFEGVTVGVGVWPSVVPGTACGVESVFEGDGCEAGAGGLLGDATTSAGGGVDLGTS